ncbi:MAG: hypothetical protein A3G33_08450 [Omnitrophica bacterium RIFCSPLOWO2_12_FULL_44_17]|uniref:YdhG-like domain-containing protein n=1 Tax=Candidatus Danuiimicrobium aquiferis TaxID=1801832 RepID=A0A1G1KWF1_9BACT|nr:MAG: hypothetical protein A3B72_03670 [Omnitrophica bacterium RIFCSPHIGHO2_02_FULL_45_28]OGW92052.1 MAG: hypothetical protein A3E74_01945 [Omnitrophica bacterium RIFCSPHIGHO2_12_FULL_44_12]OGW97195.1 MAG: hypothetical protein A3G33_08450 [Omnitrophica bacterium RIFCSPLOWO2_12_FULL_44_17]OGX02251.1 MAG: hypothetical protein A3J12_08240 [Omnitrophica bacterium RIFCSPLOWO2_02_FULL_44_11]
MVNFQSEKNKACLNYIKPKRKAESNFADSIECDPKATRKSYHELGMYEEVVKMFWDDITKKLPCDCRWILYGRPVLVNPKNGIVFGFIFSNVSFAFRLPQELRTDETTKYGHTKQELFREGSIDIVDILGQDWLLFYAKEPDVVSRTCAIAYNYTNSLQS